jgi:hypothetical protein
VLSISLSVRATKRIDTLRCVNQGKIGVFSDRERNSLLIRRFISCLMYCKGSYQLRVKRFMRTGCKHWGSPCMMRRTTDGSPPADLPIRMSSSFELMTFRIILRDCLKSTSDIASGRKRRTKPTGRKKTSVGRKKELLDGIAGMMDCCVTSTWKKMPPGPADDPLSATANRTQAFPILQAAALIMRTGQESLGARLVSRQAKKKGPHSHRRRKGQWIGSDRGCFISGPSEKSRSGQIGRSVGTRGRIPIFSTPTFYCVWSRP